MASANLYIDIDRGIAVGGVNDSTAAKLPRFVQADSLKLRIWLLSGYGRLRSFDQVPVAGITLEVALGAKSGSGATYYTQQFTWTPSGDLGQPYFEATLPMNTAEIDDLLGANPTAPAWFQIRKTEDGTPTTVLQEPITIHASVIQDGVAEVPAPLTPLSAEAANAAFVRVIHTGSFDLMNVNGKGVRIYVDDDGAFRTDPIS